MGLCEAFVRSCSNVKQMAWLTLNWEVISQGQLLWCRVWPVIGFSLSILVTGFSRRRHCWVNVLVTFDVFVLAIPCPSLRFEAAPKNKMLWRTNQLQMSGLRSSNAASFLVSDALESSAALSKAILKHRIMFVL